MSIVESTCQVIADDIWAWIRQFVMAPNKFYDYKFPPCPFAKQAVQAKTVDVLVWQNEDVRAFIRVAAVELRNHPSLTTRVMAFPPATRFTWGLNDFVEDLNVELVSDNVFLNTGIAQTSRSKFSGSNPQEPYFIVIANSLDAVLAGAKSLAKTDYYKNWPKPHYAHVVERRARFARKYRHKPKND